MYVPGKMKHLEKLKKLTQEIDGLLEQNINPESQEFEGWHLRTERVLKQLFGEESDEYKCFKNTPFYPTILSLYDNEFENDAIEACRNGLVTTRTHFNVYIEEAENDIEEVKTGKMVSGPNRIPDISESNNEIEMKSLFIVHGHDGELKQKVARLVESQGICPIILDEESNAGRTIIEKLETYSEVDAAICLLTSDDKMESGHYRARQNVIFEMGFFYGKIGRRNTIVIADENVELFSDISGVVITDKSNWQLNLLKELDTIGFDIDLNKLK